MNLSNWRISAMKSGRTQNDAGRHVLMARKDIHLKLSKKPDSEHDSQANGTDKIWCPYREGFRYIKACISNCKKKEKCRTFRDYREPRLF